MKKWILEVVVLGLGLIIELCKLVDDILPKDGDEDLKALGKDIVNEARIIQRATMTL